MCAPGGLIIRFLLWAFSYQARESLFFCIYFAFPTDSINRFVHAFSVALGNNSLYTLFCRPAHDDVDHYFHTYQVE